MYDGNISRDGQRDALVALSENDRFGTGGLRALSSTNGQRDGEPNSDRAPR
jgi:hypothetical protein